MRHFAKNDISPKSVTWPKRVTSPEERHYAKKWDLACLYSDVLRNEAFSGLRTSGPGGGVTCQSHASGAK